MATRGGRANLPDLRPGRRFFEGMNSLIRRGIITGLLFFLLSCIGVSIAMRLAAPNAVVIGVGAVVLLLGYIYFAIGLQKRRKAPPEGQAVPLPPSVQEVGYRGSLARQYKKQLKRLEIPKNAAAVYVGTDLFAPTTANLLHYLWRTDTHLWLFPRWDSIESTLELLEYLGRQPRFTPALYAVRIPLENIHYYRFQEPVRETEGFVLLRYRSVLEEEIGLMLEEDALSALNALLPNKNYKIIEEQRYPASAKQINDITAKMVQLKELHEQVLITDTEYETKKAELLTAL